jgi:hypothetical protein
VDVNDHVFGHLQCHLFGIPRRMGSEGAS